MGTYPWGPHGPQSGPNEVTPNPTPAYVPPASTPDWSSGSNWGTPTTGSGGGYQQPVYTGAVPAYSGPPLKSYFIAFLLTVIFGALGLFYASKKGAIIMLVFLVLFPFALTTVGAAPGVYVAGQPWTILKNDNVMASMWSLCTFLSVIWSIFAVRSFNKASRANFKS